MVNTINSNLPSALPLYQPAPAEAAGATQRAQVMTGPTVITDPRERQAVHTYIRDLFIHHEMRMPRGASAEQTDAVNDHNQKLRDLAQSRADTLLDMGERRADIEAVMRNAFTLDRYATSGTALVGGLPFTAVTAAQFANPNLTVAPTNFVLRNIANRHVRENPLVRNGIDGAVGALEAHVPDEFFQHLFADAKADRFFLKPDDSKLHDVITASLGDKRLSTFEEGLEDLKQIQTYLARAITTNVISAVLIGTGHPEKAELFEKYAVALGNYAAGFATAHWKHSAENSRYQRGEALLLGIRDAEPNRSLHDEREWLNVYMAAKQGSVWTALAHSGARMGDMLLSASVNSLDALGKALTGANSLVAGGVGLGGSLAARSVAQTVTSAQFSSPLKQAVAGRTVNAFGTGVAFGIWAFLAATTHPISAAAKNAVNEYRKPSGTASDRATSTGINLQASIAGTGSSSSSLRRRSVRLADAEAQSGGEGRQPVTVPLRTLQPVTAQDLGPSDSGHRYA